MRIVCHVLLYQFVDIEVWLCVYECSRNAAAALFFLSILVRCIFFSVQRSHSIHFYMRFALVRIIVIFIAINNLLLHYVWIVWQGSELNRYMDREIESDLRHKHTIAINFHCLVCNYGVCVHVFVDFMLFFSPSY